LKRILILRASYAAHTIPQYRCDNAVVTQAAFLQRLNATQTWPGANSSTLTAAPRCSDVLARWALLTTLAPAPYLCATNATLASAVSAYAAAFVPSGNNASAAPNATQLQAEAAALVANGTLAVGGAEAPLSQWCKWATGSAPACGSCAGPLVERRTVCACPLDYTGAQCTVPRPVTCSVRMVAPAPIDSACGSGAGSGSGSGGVRRENYDPRYMGAGEPCRFTPTIGAPLTLAFNVSCAFQTTATATAPREGPSDLAALTGFVWNQSYGFVYNGGRLASSLALSHPSPSAAANNKPLSLIVKVFDVNRLSDGSVTRSASLAFANFSGQSLVTIALPANALSADRHAPAGRVYFETGVAASSGVGATSWPGYAAGLQARATPAVLNARGVDVQVRQHIEVADWRAPRYRDRSGRWPVFLIVALVLFVAAAAGAFVYKLYQRSHQKSLKRFVAERVAGVESHPTQQRPVPLPMQIDSQAMLMPTLPMRLDTHGPPVSRGGETFSPRGSQEVHRLSSNPVFAAMAMAKRPVEADADLDDQ
jgi:hypothetical protein